MKSSKPRFNVVGQLGSLRRYARSLTRNEAEAEDLVQDTLVRAYERRGGFRDGGNLKGWLLSILHNGFIDCKRSSQAEARRENTLAVIAETSPPTAAGALHTVNRGPGCLLLVAGRAARSSAFGRDRKSFLRRSRRNVGNTDRHADVENWPRACDTAFSRS